MKCVCVGRNYVKHAQELGNAVPEEPLFFIKPSTAILPKGAAFRIPEWTREVHHEVELVYRIGKRCTGVQEKEARNYVEGVTLGLDLTARDVQDRLKKAGAPWEQAKAFDGSAVLGSEFLPLADLDTELDFSLERNGVRVQHGRSSDMHFSVPVLIVHISRFVTLEAGDLLFTGTPAGVGPILPGDVLTGILEGSTMFQLRVEG